jgi:hypothetical protein
VSEYLKKDYADVVVKIYDICHISGGVRENFKVGDIVKICDELVRRGD